jgi:Glycosyltransferase family 87
MRVATHSEPADLSREVIKSFAILGGFFFVVAVGTYLYSLDVSTTYPRDGSTLVVGRDFLNFWMYGRAASLPDPGHWYDAAAYQHALATLLGPGYPGQNWSYPPTVMLIAAPFGRLGYLPALLLWTILNLAIFFVVAVRHVADRRTLLALMICPAAAFCLMSGQSSFLTSAVLIGIFALLDRRPLIAGVLIGLLTLKPQLGLLLPVVLIASGRWRVFAAAAVTTLVLAALAAALFGTQAWIAFVTQGLPTQNIVLADPEGIATPFYPTVFMNLRGIGLGYSAAMVVQVCFALAAVAAVAWAFRYRADADPPLLFALFTACSVAAVPYLLVYDTLPLCFAVLALLAANRLDNRGAWLARLVFWLPLLQIGLGNLHIPGPALIAPLCALYIIERLRNAPAPALRPALNAG